MTCQKCLIEFDQTYAKTGRPHIRCEKCRAVQAKAQQQYRDRNPRSTADYQRQFHRKARIEALGRYGGACACCGETYWQFLTFDHPEGGGVQHRKEIATRGNGFVSWLKRNDYPPEFRVLCQNCNSARGYYGACPHEG